MQLRRLSFLPILLPLLCLASFAQDAPERYSALNGNWHLTGGWEMPLQSPRLTLSLSVNEDKIYGRGDFQMNCPDSHSGLGMSFEAQGEIASDGSFVLNNLGALPDLPSARIFDSISIKGRVPDQGATEWSGSFAVALVSQKGRCAKLSGDFVATQFAPLNGAYSGTITDSSNGSTATVLVDVDLAQGIFSSAHGNGFTLSEPASSDRVYYYLPVTGTVTVSGFSSERITANAIANACSRMQGDGFILCFILEDGSTMTLSGFFTDSTETILNVQVSYQPKGKSTNDSAMGKLTRR